MVDTDARYVKRFPHRACLGLDAAGASTSARARVICFPHAGGSAQAYRTFHKHLPADVEVCAIQPPGRDERGGEPAHRDLGVLVREVVEAIGPLLDRPFAFFGHSMGALAAFETTRALRTRGMPQPTHLFVSGRRAPQLAHDRAPLHDLDDAAFLDGLRRYEGTPDVVLRDPELAQVFLPTIRADVCAVETYRFETAAPLACPIVACGGVGDPDVSRDHLARWREMTSGPFQLAMFPGGHFYLREREARVVQLVRDSIDARRHGDLEQTAATG
jgi:medium-chain acyl-[acyl-carrier-protein] hydrolase